MTRTMVSLCFVAFLASAALAQEPPSPPQPTAEHKILAADAGTWDATVKAYAEPGAEPMVTKGTETIEVMLGGLWVLSRFEASFGPAKFEGRGQFGYDPSKKKYVGTWIDSAGANLSVLEGTYDAKTKTMTYTGESYEPERKVKYSQRLVTTTNDDGTRVFRVFMKFENEPAEVKLMEITYTKRK